MPYSVMYTTVGQFQLDAQAILWPLAMKNHFDEFQCISHPASSSCHTSEKHGRLHEHYKKRICTKLHGFSGRCATSRGFYSAKNRQQMQAPSSASMWNALTVDNLLHCSLPRKLMMINNNFAYTICVSHGMRAE